MMFHGVQGLPPPRQILFVLGKMAGDARVKIPTIVIEAHVWIGEQLLHVGRRLVFQPFESNHHVGHLHARVVNNILHLYSPAARAQHTHERIAQHRVAQMSDVGGLVRIDIGVLDDNLAGNRLAGFVRCVQYGVTVSAAIEPHVDVAVARHFERRHAFDRSQACHQIRRDRARRLLQLARQMKRHRNRKFTEGGLLGLFESAAGLHAIFGPDILGDSAGNLLFDGMKHCLQVCVTGR